jgi:hypothetical protein
VLDAERLREVAEPIDGPTVAAWHMTISSGQDDEVGAVGERAARRFHGEGTVVIGCEGRAQNLGERDRTLIRGRCTRPPPSGAGR